jgi:hypothetical protein
MMCARFLYLVLTRCALLLACALFLPPIGAQAQGSSGPQPPAPDSVVARSLDQDASEKPAYFVEVRDALKSKMTERGLDPGKQAFHFVVLYNATAPLTAGYGREKEVIAGMLRHFFAQEDHVSLVPYQLWVRENMAAWNKPLSQDTAEQMYKQIPDKSERRDGYNGGHDLDAALITALQKTREAGLLDNTVFLALADGQFSDTPLEPKNYALANADAELSKANIVKAVEQARYWKYGGTDDTAQYSVTYRIYLPQSLKPLDIIKKPQGSSTLRPSDTADTPRDESVAAIWGNPKIGEHKDKPAEDKPTDYTGLLTVLGGMALLVVVVWYRAWLFKPRTLNVGINSLRPATVTFNKPLYLGAADNPKSNMVQIDSLPSSVASNEKIARLELTPLGAIRLRGERWKADRDPVVIQLNMPKVRLSRGQNTGMLGGSDQISVQITLTK